MLHGIAERFRLRRSVLYVPGSNLRAIDKARRLPCDAIILDLEDAVAPESKLAARDSALTALRDGGFGHRELIVRVNALDTEWGPLDLAAASQSAADAILVPKIRTEQDLQQYQQALGNAAPSMQLWAMIETAHAVLRLEAIATVAHHSRLSCLVLGTNDLATELRMQIDPLRTALTAMLSLAVAAARAHGLDILDGVYSNFDDAPGFEPQCRQGLQYGFDGKTLIHPRQIAVCNSVFTPSATMVSWAQQVKATFERPENSMKGAVSLDGAMIERLHLSQAERILTLEAAIRHVRLD